MRWWTMMAVVLALVPQRVMTAQEARSESQAGRGLDVRTVGAIGDGEHDDTAAVQRGLDLALAGQRVLHFPAGEYRCVGAVQVAGAKGRAERLTLSGDGRRSSILRMEGEEAGLGIDGKTTFVSGIIMRDLAIRGRGNAASRKPLVRLRLANYALIENCDIGWHGGPGLVLEDCQDCQFWGMDVRESCSAMPGTAGLSIQGQLSNSLTFVGCTFERHYGPAASLENADAVRLLGCKFHGRITEDEPDGRPAPYDLLRVTGGGRIVVEACQFVHGHSAAIRVAGNGGREKISVVVHACSFARIGNYAEKGDAWGVHCSGARLSLVGNDFTRVLMPGGGERASYLERGGDVFLGQGADCEHAANLFADGGVRSVVRTTGGHIP